MTAQPALPRAYAQFAELFAQFEAPMVETLGGLLASFASRLDLPHSYEAQPQGEFTGFDGISNLGELAHLLESDWLQRELDADDFVRRIAEREVFYRQPAYEDSGKTNTLAVVLDCGPWMLGRNRLCALAALFHLAAVAERRNATLRWLVPHGRQPHWASGLSRQTIGQFLGQIVQVEASGAQLDQALDALDAEGRLDLWYVGAAQTAGVAEAIGATASFLVETHYPPAETDARIAVRTTGRRTQLDVTYPPEDTCVAALRRPFKPEAHARRPATDTDRIGKEPFDTLWVLDRFSQSILVRMPDGLLWQPLMGQRPGLWMPFAPEELLLGVGFERDGDLSLALATPTADQYRVDLLRVLRDGTSFTCDTQGRLPLSPKHISSDGLPPLDTSEPLSFIRTNGVRVRIEPAEGSPMRVFWATTNHRIDISSGEDPVLQVTNRQKQTLLRTPVSASIASLAGQRRHVLFSPSSKAVAISRDGATYSVLSPSGEATAVTLTAGHDLLGIEASLKATVWVGASGTVMKTSLGGSTRASEVLARITYSRLRTPRYCPITGTIFAVQEDEHGRAESILPVLATRGWAGATGFNILDAIQKAKSVWPAA